MNRQIESNKILNMTPEQFANHLFSNENMEVSVIRQALGLPTFNPTNTDKTKKIPSDLAPSMGNAFSDTPIPLTNFENRLKKAGGYRTVGDALQSVVILDNLLEEASNNKDIKAVYAVLNRALVTTCRAFSREKVAQGKVFSSWLTRNL